MRLKRTFVIAVSLVVILFGFVVLTVMAEPTDVNTLIIPVNMLFPLVPSLVVVGDIGTASIELLRAPASIMTILRLSERD